jgi:hypothetical protein
MSDLFTQGRHEGAHRLRLSRTEREQFLKEPAELFDSIDKMYPKYPVASNPSRIAFAQCQVVAVPDRSSSLG